MTAPPRVPDWPELLAARARGTEDPVAWREAIAVLAEGGAGSDEALRLDPTLLVHRLPLLPVAESEVEAMKSAVAASRRARRLEEAVPRRHGRRAVAAALALLAVALLPWLLAPGADDRLSPPAVQRPATALPAPLLEDLHRPGARVYELSADDVSVVLIVDESLDV